MSLEVKMNNETKRPNPKFTLEFKQDAAKLVLERGYTHQQASDNLGVSEVFRVVVASTVKSQAAFLSCIISPVSGLCLGPPLSGLRWAAWILCQFRVAPLHLRGCRARAVS